MSYTLTLDAIEMTALILSTEDRLRGVRESLRTARELAHPLVDVDQIEAAAADYERLLAKLRATPRNSDALDALLRAGEADRAPLFPNH